MTIKPPKPSMADRLLKALGKKRGVIMPANPEPYAYYKGTKENFFKALWRPAGRDLPPGYTDIFDLLP